MLKTRALEYATGASAAAWLFVALCPGPTDTVFFALLWSAIVGGSVGYALRFAGVFECETYERFVIETSVGACVALVASTVRIAGRLPPADVSIVASSAALSVIACARCCSVKDNAQRGAPESPPL